MEPTPVAVVIGVDGNERRRVQAEEVGVARRGGARVADEVRDLVQVVDGADRRQLFVGTDDETQAVAAGGILAQERLPGFDVDLGAPLHEAQDELVDVRRRRARREQAWAAAAA